MRFELGQSVRWTHRIDKERGDLFLERASIPSQGRVFWEVWELEEPQSGIIVGFRSLSEYRLTSVNDFDDPYLSSGNRTEATIIPGTARRAWLVVKDLRSKPLLVPDEHIEGEKTMSEQYVPTTDEVAASYVLGESKVNPAFKAKAVLGDFHRWIAQHDREVAAEASAKAYREMSDDLRGLSVGQRIIDGNSYIKLARLIDRLNGYEDRAAEIENGADQ